MVGKPAVKIKVWPDLEDAAMGVHRSTILDSDSSVAAGLAAIQRASQARCQTQASPDTVHLTVGPRNALSGAYPELVVGVFRRVHAEWATIAR
jgi:hypothetical protein